MEQVKEIERKLMFVSASRFGRLTPQRRNKGYVFTKRLGELRELVYMFWGTENSLVFARNPRLLGSPSCGKVRP